MAKEEYMHLQHSESVVAQMAATVFAGLIQKQELNSANEDALVEKSVEIAIKLAVLTEKRVSSDEEWIKRDKGSSVLIG